MLGLAPGDHRRQEDPGRHERGRHPEQRELDMPGAHQVVREHLREVEAEEAVDLSAIVLAGGPDDRLDQEQRRHHEEEPRASRAAPASARRRRASGTTASPARVRASPGAAPAPEDAEEDADAAEQRDQRQHRPDDHVGGRPVVDARLRRPVVRVGVVVARALSRGRPRRPGEERRQLPQLVAIRDRLPAQAVLRSSESEKKRL